MSKPSELAIHLAAQCWCDPRVSDRVMDPELAMVFAEQLDAVMSMRAQMQWLEDRIAGVQEEMGGTSILWSGDKDE